MKRKKVQPQAEGTQKVKWTIDEESKSEVYPTIEKDADLVKKWPKFERDVTTDPYYHPKAKRIEKLKGSKTFPEGTYRYRDDPLRVVYYPEGQKKVVYVLEAASTTDISYKKKSKS